MCFKCLLQILKHFNMWLLKYEKRYAHNDSNVDVQMYIATWQIIRLQYCICYAEKQTKTLVFWLLQI